MSNLRCEGHGGKQYHNAPFVWGTPVLWILGIVRTAELDERIIWKLTSLCAVLILWLIDVALDFFLKR